MTREEIVNTLKKLKAGIWTDDSSEAIAIILDEYLDRENEEQEKKDGMWITKEQFKDIKDATYEVGKLDAEEKMRENAVEVEVCSAGLFVPLIKVGDEKKIPDVKFGDKIKIIILKDDE